MRFVQSSVFLGGSLTYTHSGKSFDCRKLKFLSRISNRAANGVGFVQAEGRWYDFGMDEAFSMGCMAGKLLQAYQS